MSKLDFSHEKMRYILDYENGIKTLDYGLESEPSWLNKEIGSNEFEIQINGQVIDGKTKGLRLVDIKEETLDKNTKHHIIELAYKPFEVNIECHTIFYHDTSLMEKWVTVKNDGTDNIRVNRIDSISFALAPYEYELMYYTGSWGMEFDSIREPLNNKKVLETRKGRSSNDQHPWFTLFRSDGQIMTGTVMWSGNWAFRFEPLNEGGYRLTGGLNDWGFYKDLEPNQTLESPHVAIAIGQNNDLNETSVQFARVGRNYWYAQNELSQELPAEWNHWWPYEDHSINEEVFKANVDVAAKLDVDICTLDAGWFGPTDPDTFWNDYRGDWNLVNSVRFPNGIRAVSDYVHEKGMKFGLWCEIEALGQYAQLAVDYPEYVALRDGERLGYVCFANPDVRKWAIETLSRLITEYRCSWIKLDFNLDPGAGCNRTDHGHGSGDGLFEHYRGYYEVLTEIRKKHPNVIMENCSSGGLRIDLGMLQHTHTTFLSDPDWPEHGLQLFWGATTMLAPEVCLHWGYSDWYGEHRKQKFNPKDPKLTQHQLDYYIRIAMLGGFGFSQKFSEMPKWVADRYAYHTQVYKDQVRQFTKNADLYRLTDQPRRFGEGDRWAAFQYSLPEEDEHLVFVFRLDQSEQERTIYLRNLNEKKIYNIGWLSEEKTVQRTGADIMNNGIRFDDLQEEESVLMVIK